MNKTAEIPNATPIPGMPLAFVPITHDGNARYIPMRDAASWDDTAGLGTVTSVGSGTGLTGGPITSAGTLSLANIANNTMLGNVSGTSAAPIALTAAQITALLNVFTSSLQGVVPHSSGSSTEYLAGDGNWRAVSTGNIGCVLTCSVDLLGESATAYQVASTSTNADNYNFTSIFSTTTTWAISATMRSTVSGYAPPTGFVTYNSINSSACTGGGIDMTVVTFDQAIVGANMSAATTGISASVAGATYFPVTPTYSAPISWSSSTVTLPAYRALGVKFVNSLVMSGSGTISPMIIFTRLT